MIRRTPLKECADGTFGCELFVDLDSIELFYRAIAIMTRTDRPDALIEDDVKIETTFSFHLPDAPGAIAVPRDAAAQAIGVGGMDAGEVMPASAKWDHPKAVFLGALMSWPPFQRFILPKVTPKPDAFAAPIPVVTNFMRSLYAERGVNGLNDVILEYEDYCEEEDFEAYPPTPNWPEDLR